MEEIKETKECKKVKIISQFNCQTYPLDDTAIEISLEDLEQIGVTKCFDVENNCVIDYDNSHDLRKKEIQDRINELKQLLKDSDYRAIKYAEGQYTKTEYAPYKEQRQTYRDEINSLEEELNKLNKPLEEEEK